MLLNSHAQPLFSIIIPTYARPTELADCLHRWRTLALVLLSQVANGAGFLREAVTGRQRQVCRS